MEPKPPKCKPPEHVTQFSPDFSMLSHSKLKRRRKRKGDDSFVWLGDVGTTSFRKKPKPQKKKRKVGVIIANSFLYPWPCRRLGLVRLVRLVSLPQACVINT